jgi:hypothetical protein
MLSIPCVARAPPVIPTPPTEVVALLTSNDAPEENEVPVVREYIVGLLRHLSLWKTVHMSLFWRDHKGPNQPDAFKDYEDTLHEMISARRRGKLASLRVFLQSAFQFEPQVQRFLGSDYEGFNVHISSEHEKPSFMDVVTGK